MSGYSNRGPPWGKLFQEKEQNLTSDQTGFCLRRIENSKKNYKYNFILFYIGWQNDLDSELKKF